MSNLEKPESDAIIRTAYEAHFKLVQHYSSIVFQARVAITTMIVLAIGLGLQLLPLGDSYQIEWLGVPARGLAVYAAALLVNLLHAMEVSYLKRFYQIVQGGRRIEREHGAESYFSAYDKPESWPLHLAYAVGVLVMVSIFLGAAWSNGQASPRSVLLVIAALLPLVTYWFSIDRLRSHVHGLLKGDGGHGEQPPAWRRILRFLRLAS